MKKTNRIFTTLIFIFLYAPMLVLIVGSFNEGKSLSRFDGFTLEQYAELFRDEDLLKLLGNSILISILASGVATVFGSGYLQFEAQNAACGYAVDGYSYDQSGYCYRYLSFVAVRICGNEDAGSTGQSDLLDLADCPYHI